MSARQNNNKALIVFSDGTGNKGGVTNDTNIWRLYQMVDRSNSSCEQQITFYDDGVGTSSFSISKILGSAIGIGLSANIREAYHFLVNNYSRGDRIFMFGFSRGGYTVRCLLGLINACGLVKRHDAEGKPLCSIEIKRRVKEVFKAYRSVEPGAPDVELARNNKVTVEFIGVWDTVDAVGMPFKLKSGVYALLEKLKKKKVYRFRDQEVRGVRYARQALAIDDERRTFHPNYWDKAGDYTEIINGEQGQHEVTKKVNLHQMWFAGAHSNCGGSYPKDGLAYITLDWMISEYLQAKEQTLEESDNNPCAYMHLSGEEIGRVRDLANEDDVINDSRSGYATYYRYRPRQLSELAGNSNDDINVHVSVLNRISKRTMHYAPLFIDAPEGKSVKLGFTRHPESHFSEARQEAQDFPVLSREQLKSFHKLVDKRRNLYKLFTAASVFTLVWGLFSEPKKNWSDLGFEEVVGLSATASAACESLPARTPRAVMVSLREPGACAEVSVEASKVRNRTGVWLEQGLTYSFEIVTDSNDAQWSDSKYPASAKYGRAGSWLENIFRVFSYDRSARYMELLGLVDGEVIPLGKKATTNQQTDIDFSESIKKPERYTPGNYVAEVSGELLVFTNEPVWPAYVFHRNNEGNIRLRINAESAQSGTLGIGSEPEEAQGNATGTSGKPGTVSRKFPDVFKTWLAQSLKTILPAPAERIIDNLLSYTKVSFLLIACMLYIFLRGRYLRSKIAEKARAAWDNVHS